MNMKRNRPALRRILPLLLCLALLLPQLSLAAGTKKASRSEIRVLLTRLNLADQAWMTLEGRYLARCADGSEALLPAGAKVTVLLRNGQLVFFHDGLSLNAGQELKLLRSRVPVFAGTLALGAEVQVYAGGEECRRGKCCKY